jgi:hypothetical protein
VSILDRSHHHDTRTKMCFNGDGIPGIKALEVHVGCHVHEEEMAEACGLLSLPTKALHQCESGTYKIHTRNTKNGPHQDSSAVVGNTMVDVCPCPLYTSGESWRGPPISHRAACHRFRETWKHISSRAHKCRGQGLICSNSYRSEKRTC